MSRRPETGATGPLLFSPEESSRLLNAEEQIRPSWLKEKARRREIPHCVIGGKYMFTAEHLAEIIRQFERKPATAIDVVPARDASGVTGGKRKGPNTESGKSATLAARTPRRRKSAA